MKEKGIGLEWKEICFKVSGKASLKRILARPEGSKEESLAEIWEHHFWQSKQQVQRPCGRSLPGFYKTQQGGRC